MDSTLNKKTLSLQSAKKIIEAAKIKAAEIGVCGAIAVVDEAGSLMCLERLDNTMPAAAQIAIGKASTAAVFRRPTTKIESLIQEQRLVMLALGGITDTKYVPLMGAYPIEVEGQIVGAVSVAGAETGENDEIIALAASETVLE